MIRVDAYRCSYCGKLFLTERGCVKHEEKYCGKTPRNIAACYSCKWYKETGQTTTITITGLPPLAGHEQEYEKTANHIQTSGGYDSFVPYKKVKEDLKANGFDVIVFVPSYDEDNGLITCGNAILSGKKPTSSYKEVIF